MSLPEIVMVPLSKIRDNPWRDKKRNPINPEKVEQIAESIISTGEFWIGVYGRKIAGDLVEIAFGHHRTDAAKAVDTGGLIEAAKSAGLKSIPVALRDFTDGDMLMRMARENLRGELPAVLEVVAASVRAYGEGKIELPASDPSTNASALRYAPSFLPGKLPGTSVVPRPYTADTLARFLGGIYIRRSSKKAADSVRAALGILELEEKKIPGATDLRLESRPAREIIPMVSEIKQRYEIVQERRGKSQEEIKKLDEQRRAAQAKAKADEVEAEKTHKELVRKLAGAERESKVKEAEELAKRIKENDKRAKEKEELNKVRAAEFEQQLEAKKKWEAAQRVQDAYLPIRRDVEVMMQKLETIISERNPFREDVKSLANRKGITEVDKQRLAMAAVNVANWYFDWVVPQFSPERKVSQKKGS